MTVYFIGYAVSFVLAFIALFFFAEYEENENRLLISIVGAFIVGFGSWVIVCFLLPDVFSKKNKQELNVNTEKKVEPLLTAEKAYEMSKLGEEKKRQKKLAKIEAQVTEILNLVKKTTENEYMLKLNRKLDDEVKIRLLNLGFKIETENKNEVAIGCEYPYFKNSIVTKISWSHFGEKNS